MPSALTRPSSRAGALAGGADGRATRRTRLVTDNAIANAVKHGGATEVRPAVSSLGNEVRVIVDDNGKGVPEVERSRVFERCAARRLHIRGPARGSHWSRSRPSCTAAQRH